MYIRTLQGADVNGRGPFDLTPLLMLCAADGHEFVIARLLEAGADVHAQDVIGNTALHEAVYICVCLHVRAVQVVSHV
jgi:ankyrin repeat protein